MTNDVAVSKQGHTQKMTNWGLLVEEPGGGKAPVGQVMNDVCSEACESEMTQP